MVKYLRYAILLYIVYALVHGPMHGRVPLYDGILALVISVVLVDAAFLLLRTKTVRALLSRGLADSEPSNEEYAQETWGWRWFLFGFLALAVSIAVLEFHQHFYFTQDDAFSENLPKILQGCRSLMAGSFSTWNPYQFMGMPTSSMPSNVQTYPPTYLAYIIARYIFGNEYLTIEILSIGHILAGYYLMYRLLKYLGVRSGIACAGSLSLMLSGFTLIMGRSWFHVIIMMVWAIPLAEMIARMQHQRTGWRWAVWTGLVIGISYHAGNPQLWAYSIMFFVLAAAVLVLSGSIERRKTVWVLSALVLGLAIAAPLLVPQSMETANAYRMRSSDYGAAVVHRDTASFLLPYPLAVTRTICDEIGGIYGGVNHRYIGEFCYSGTLFYALAFLILILSVFYPWSSRTVRRNIWLILGAVALLFAMGPEGGLWPALKALPVFSKFTGPFKFTGFMNLFVILGCALVIERLLRFAGHRRIWEYALSLTVIALLVYHCTLPLPAFYDYGDRPYPKIPKEMASILQPAGRGFPARTLGVGTCVSPVNGFVFSLVRNFATVYRIPVFDGYDVLAAVTPENALAAGFMWAHCANACRTYGIRWLVVHHSVDRPILTAGSNKPVNYMESTVTLFSLSEVHLPFTGLSALRASAHPVLRTKDVDIYELSRPDPMAFLTTPDHALPIRINDNDAQVDLSGCKPGGMVTINFLNRKWTAVFADGRQIPSTADRWGRIVADVPPNTRTVAVRYSPPWGSGLIVSVALLLAALILMRSSACMDKAAGE